jgi:hypothetical protein
MRRIVAAILVCLTPTVAFAQMSYPMLMSAKPVAVQVGTSGECTVNSRYTMHGAYQVLVTGSGVTGEVLPPPAKPEDAQKKPELTKMNVRFTAAADALPGVRDFRIATPQGVSTVGQLVIVRDPVVAEAPKNDKPDEAQQVTLPRPSAAASRRPRTSITGSSTPRPASRLPSTSVPGGWKTRSTTCRTTWTRSSRSAARWGPCWLPATTSSLPTR